MTDLKALSDAATLLPCPFCGGGAYIARDFDEDGYGTFCKVKCSKCGSAAREKYHTKGNDCPQFYAEVRDFWNTRPEVQAARNEALDEAAEAISDYQAFTKYNRDPLTREMMDSIRALKEQSNE